MAFNWFNRQNKDSATNTDAELKEKDTLAVSESASEIEESSSATTTPEISTDLLAFAKAAYKNIQEKQEPQLTTDEVQDEPSSPATEEADAEELTVESTTHTQDSIEVAQSPQEIVSTEAVESTLVEPKTPSASITSEDETQATSQEEAEPTPTNLSFLERAAAERGAKQERLIASAIEIKEPEKPQTSESVPTEEIPLIDFDDGFIWSTEVLAAQGRRADDISIEEITWLKRLRQGLDKTRRNIVNQLKSIVGQGPLNQAAVDEIEAALLQADVGVEATDHIIDALQQKLKEQALPPEEGIAYLKKILRDMLNKPLEESGNYSLSLKRDSLNIWLMTGVNGAGKTTTIGKLAHLAQKSGYNCLIGAADTFRAAAVEQVKIWGVRSGVEVIANPGKNTDPAAVVFDAIAAAESRCTELLLVDTAGRLQNKKNLMEELSKVRRIINKKAPDAKVESLLVLDATLGQNGLRQAEVFSQAAQLSGVVLTKLDSTARGGVALAVVQQLGLPIRFIGAGEGIEDLRPFSSYEFVEALLSG
ncbi:MAG: signal recognition particle-docking protein FtsY [Richelia sp.]|nr:signal recognition particle-docking protein FtsY [Richelia sp.]